MKKYIGTKEVLARPMTAEVAIEKGYRINGDGDDGYEIEYKDGYKSWCPAKAFEEAYSVAETPLDRMEHECFNLCSAIGKLERFIEKQNNGTSTVKVSPMQKNLLSIQLHSMQTYCECLTLRIKEMIKETE